MYFLILKYDQWVKIYNWWENEINISNDNTKAECDYTGKNAYFYLFLPNYWLSNTRDFMMISCEKNAFCANQNLL